MLPSVSNPAGGMPNQMTMANMQVETRSEGNVLRRLTRIEGVFAGGCGCGGNCGVPQNLNAAGTGCGGCCGGCGRRAATIATTASRPERVRGLYPSGMRCVQATRVEAMEEAARLAQEASAPDARWANEGETYWPASGAYFIYRSLSTNTWGIAKAKRFQAVKASWRLRLVRWWNAGFITHLWWETLLYETCCIQGDCKIIIGHVFHVFWWFQTIHSTLYALHLWRMHECSLWLHPLRVQDDMLSLGIYIESQKK